MSQSRQTPLTDPAEFSDTPRPVVTLANDYPAGYEIVPHRHARAQLVYAAQGVMTVTATAGSWVVPPQRAVWIPAGAEHTVRVDRAIAMRSLFIRPDAAPRLPRACRVVTVSPLLLADPADARGLAAWARAAGASPRTLARLFAKETGLTFRAWRQRARLLHALVELAARKPVTSVAFEAGYDSPSAFIAAFKREFGTTPARYFRDQASD